MIKDPTIDAAELIQFKHHNIALLFSDYLNSVGISATVRNDRDGYSVLCEHGAWQQARDLCDEFIQQPHHPKYQQAAWQQGKASSVKSHIAANSEGFIQQFVNHAGLVTLTVFSACWLIYLASAFGWAPEVFSQLRFYGAFSVATIVAEPYRLIGPALFHFSLLHIAFNTMWWWQLGGQVEHLLGKKTLLMLFLFAALLSNTGQFLVSGPNFGGLSGVVYALVGFVWWYGWLVPNKGLSLSKSIVGFMLVWLVLGFVDVLPVAVANTAHLLGLLSGCFYAWLLAQKQGAG